MNKYKKLIGDTLLFTISNFGSKVLGLILIPLYTAVLTTEQYGIADLITTTINIIYPILTLAISDATLRFAFDKDKTKNGVLNTSLLFVLVSTFLLICFFPFVKLISSQLSTYWRFFVTTYFLYNIYSCLTRFIKGIGLTKLFAVQGIINTSAIICSNILLLLVFKVGLKGYLLSVIIGYSASILFMVTFARLYRYLYPLGIDKSLIKQMLGYSIPMIPTLLAWTVNNAIDKYMIIYFYDLSKNGIYSVAHKIPTILTTFTAFFSEAWQLSAITEYGKEGYSLFFSKVYRCFNLVLIFGVIIFIPFSKFFASLLFAPAYYTAWSAVPFLLISSIFSALSGFLAAAFRASKNTKGLMKSVLIGAVINALINFTLIPLIGIKGAAAATAVSFFVVWIVRFRDAKRIVTISTNSIALIVTYMAALIIAGGYTFEIPYFFFVYAIILCIVVLINRKDIIELFVMIKNTVKKLFIYR